MPPFLPSTTSTIVIEPTKFCGGVRGHYPPYSLDTCIQQSTNVSERCDGVATNSKAVDEVASGDERAPDKTGQATWNVTECS